MHDGHDHHHHGPGGGGHAAPGPGHNHRPATGPAVQWQTPHLPAAAEPASGDRGEPDLDLVEAAFVEAFARAPDPTSFLRVANVPFVGETAEGTHLSLLRVETGHPADVGALTPHVGGGYRYDPLPAAMASTRDALTFVYFDGEKPIPLSFAEARALRNVTPPR